MSDDRRRLLMALLAASLVAPAGYGVGLHVYGIARNVAQGRLSWLPPFGAVVQVVSVIAMVGVPISLGAALLLGAPGFIMLRRYGRASRPALWILGASIGTAVALVLAPQLKGELFSIPFPWWAGAALGLLSAEAFLRVLGGGARSRPASVS